MTARGGIPWHTWRPRLLDCLPTYDRRTLTADLVAGITVGVVALPLAMAFGIASGVTPQAGIYTAIVGGFLVSMLGGSEGTELLLSRLSKTQKNAEFLETLNRDV